MNLSSFQLLKEDNDSYEIKHPKGKKLRIPKAGLSEKSHAAIKKMADGGEVEDTSNDISSAPEQEPQLMINGQAAAPAPSFSLSDIIKPSPDTYDAQGNVIQPGQNGPAPASVEAPIAAPSAPPNNPSPSVAQATDPIIQQKIDMNNLLSQSEKDIENFSKTSGVAAAQGSQAWKDYNQQVAKLQSPQDVVDAYKAKDDQLTQAIMQNKIDPHRFWNDKSTGSKIAAGIGVILGGMGAGLTHGPNQALGLIQEQINRDIDAQKNDQSKNMNLWKMNREAMGDDLRANLATQNQMLSVAQAKAAQASMVMNNAQAVLRSREMINQIEQQKAANRLRMGLLTQQASGQSPQGNLLNADPSMLVPEMVQNPEQQKQVYEEIGRAQNVSKNWDKIQQAFDLSTQENTVLRTGAGLVRTPGSVMALHQLLLPNFKAIDGTVRQAAMDETFHNITPRPGDSQHTVDLKRQALDDWMHSEVAAPTAKGNGIDLTRFASTAPPGMKPEIQQFQGVPYLKVQGGWKKVQQ